MAVAVGKFDLQKYRFTHLKVCTLRFKTGVRRHHGRIWCVTGVRLRGGCNGSCFRRALAARSARTLSPVPTSARSHFRAFPLPPVPTSARSHFRAFPLPRVPTCARSHFRPFPLAPDSTTGPFPLAPVPTYVSDALSPLEVSKVALEFGMLLRMSLGDNSAAACPCNSTVTSGRPGPPTLYSIKAGPAADVAGAVCMFVVACLDLLYGRATQPSVECKGPGCSKLGGVKCRDRGLVGRALS